MTRIIPVRLVSFSLLILVSAAAASVAASGSGGVGCTLQPCTDDSHASGKVSVGILPSGAASLTYEVTSPAYADITGIFFDVASASSIDLSQCRLSVPSNTELLGNVDTNTNKVKKASNANLKGCTKHKFTFGAAIGTPGISRDDVHTVTVQVTCPGQPLKASDFDHSLFGLRLQSVGSSPNSRGASAKLMCQAGEQQPPPDDCPPPTCEWDVSCAWSDCSNQCGTGTQERSVVCKCNGKAAADSHCTQPKPPTSQSCTESSGCKVCKWVFQPWGSCSNKCGSGSQHRTAKCMCGTHEADASHCGLCPPSELTRPCEAFTGCHDCHLVYSNFSECSTTCGSGQNHRTAKCVCGSTEVSLELGLCPAPTDLTGCCYETSGCQCSWHYGDWCPCSADDGSGCGDGHQTRPATCQTSDGVICESEQCSGQPDTTRPCEDMSHCVCEYVYSPWSECSEDCGSGFRTRTAECKCNGKVMDDSFCGGPCPPDSLKEPCTSNKGCYCSWKYDEWSECSSDCGAGVETRHALSCTADNCVGEPMMCPPELCGPKATQRPCTGEGGCKAECVAAPCTGGNGAATVTFTKGSDGSLNGVATFTSPAFGDIRGIFIDAASSSPLSSSSCTITGVHVTGTGSDTSSVPGQSSVNVDGCSVGDGSFDLAAAFGTPGISTDDLNPVSFNIKCQDKTLTVQDVQGATVAVRVNSVGDDAKGREDSLKLACVLTMAH